MKQPLSLKGRALALLAQREQSVLELRRKLMRHARAEAAPPRERRPPRGPSRDGDAEPRTSAGRSRGDAASVHGWPSGLEPADSVAVRSARVTASATPRLVHAVSTGDAWSVDRLPADDFHAGGTRVADPRANNAPADDGPTDESPAETTAQIAARVEAVIDWLREHDYLNETRFVESRVHARASRFGSLRIQRELAEHGLAMTRDAAASLRDTERARAAEVWQRKFGQAPVDRQQQGRQMRFMLARGFSPDVVRALVQLERGSSRRIEADDDAAD